MGAKKLLITIIGFVFLVMFTSLPLGAEEVGIKIGTLTIKSIPGTGHNLIIKSSSDIEAVFTDAQGKEEYYIGEMGVKLGIDLSHKTDEELGYVVISLSTDYKTGSYALQGKYFGDYASASVGGSGASVRVLVGGLNKSFTLQPLALGVNEGYGAAAGLGYLYLQKDHRK